MIWSHCNFRFFLSQFWVRSSTDFKLSKRIVLYSHEQVIGLPPPHNIPPKGLKIIDVPWCAIFPKEHTNHKGTLQLKLGILLYLQDQYLSTTSKVNLSPKQSANLKYSSNMITAVGDRELQKYAPGLITHSSKSLVKIYILTFTKI